MPPNTRFTANRILDVALELTRRDGIAAISARSVAAALGSSTGPIFKQFTSMEDLLEQLMDRIIALFVASAGENPHDDPLVGAGIGWLRFAAEQPRLYEALFLRHHDWHAKWGPVRLRLADAMAQHAKYAGLDKPARFALVGRASIVMHGLGVEIWSGRLPVRDYEALVLELAQPAVDAALTRGWTHDLHTPLTPPITP